jgi:hypothetical protein
MIYMIYNAHPIYTLIGNILLKCIGSMHELGSAVGGMLYLLEKFYMRVCMYRYTAYMYTHEYAPIQHICRITIEYIHVII